MRVRKELLDCRVLVFSIIIFTFRLMERARERETSARRPVDEPPIPGSARFPRTLTELHLPDEMHASSLHLQTHNPLSKAPIQLCALSQAATVTRLDTDRKLGALCSHPPVRVTLNTMTYNTV